jgi:alpha-galactosidase
LNHSRVGAVVGLTLALLSVASASTAGDRLPIVASQEDAFIAHDAGSDSWTIGSGRIELVVGFGSDGDLTLLSLRDPSSDSGWNLVRGPEVALTVEGNDVSLSARGSATFLNGIAEATLDGVRLTLTFEMRSRRVRISRVYACYPGSPTIETWTRVDTSSSGPVQIANLRGWQLTLPAGQVRTVSGLSGDSADAEGTGAFTLQTRDLEIGERLAIGATGRSSEQFVPFAIVDDGRQLFYGGILWSGSWQMAFRRSDDTLLAEASFPAVSTAASGQAFEIPHVFFGLADRLGTGTASALKSFIMRGIRHGRPFQPLVTYNTWFAYGTTVNEEAMVAEIDRAAGLGVELFVLDAGWWVGAGTDNDHDFDSGLGNWTVDEARFPSGLAGLAEYARSYGMKFGLWVEPERLALDTIDRRDLAREAWLATRGGDYGSMKNGQICLTRPEAWQWVFSRLTALIDQTQPDYLKWDNNSWINCDRPGHGHGANDGNFSHVRALYNLLGQLRARYPDLLIENVSGGGNRLDLGMLAFSDVAWMDDRTVPSSMVRHNVEGLSVLFPPAYLLSFIIDSLSEPLASGDLSLVMRSRMSGVPGLTFRSADIDAGIGQTLAYEIQLYKAYRNILSQASAILLTGQAPADADGWDVLEELADDGSGAIVLAFKAENTDGRLVVRPRGLRPDQTYIAYSLDIGPMGGATRGDEIMQGGIELVHAGGSRAHVIVLTAQ